MHFRGKFSFLSNFHPCKITIGSHTYGNAEAAYQALKCKGYEDKFIDLTGAEAKRLGKYLPMQEGWDEKRIDAMRYVLQLKFQDPELKQQLQQIEGNIQEDNYWNDTFWGVCNDVGENHLGKLLMEIRDMNSKPQYRIYTTYFANLRNVPENSVVVSIAQYNPKGINIPRFIDFAPGQGLLTMYKQGEITEQEYTERYMQMLSNLPNLDKIKAHMAKYTADQDKSLVFVCYEGKNKFCHRHLVAQFFSEFGIKEL